MKPSAIYSKSGKGVQEASGKTSLLKRADRSVLSAIDGRATLGEVAQKVGKTFDAAFQQLIAQLDKDGFVREVSAGAPSASSSRSAAPAKQPKPAAAPPPAATGGADDLDFTSIMPVMKRGAPPPPAPAAPAAKRPAPDPAAEQRAKEQEAALYKARQEAEARAQAERERQRLEVEAKARAEAEAKIRAETEKKVREEAEAKLKAETEAAAKAAREAAMRVAAEAKAKAEEAERKAKEEAEKARREAEELRQRLEEERKAREAEERKRREDEERRRQEEEARRAREEAERQAREEAERKRRDEEERKRREEEERRRQEEEARRVREEAERRRREEEDRVLRERAEEERALRERAEEEARASRAQQETKIRESALPEDPAAEPARASGGSLDALMADLDSFSEREEEERRARESAERKARDDKKRKAQEQAERRAREQAAEAERERQRAAEAARLREEEERRVQEEAERRVREAEEQRRLEAEERKARARAAVAPAPAEDIAVSKDDLGMDDVRRDEAAVAREARKAQREREREARQRSREARERAEAAAREQPVKYPKARRPIKWGRPVSIGLFIVLIAAVGALHLMALPMADYENAASAALGRPVKIGSGRLSLFTGVRLNLKDVRVGEGVRIAAVHAYPRVGSLIDEKKAFRRIELDGVTVPQQAIGEAVAARLGADNFAVERIVVRNLRLEGPVPLPVLAADALVGADGTVRSLTLRGPDSLNAKLTRTASGEVDFDVTAASVAVPFVPELSLSSFAMKGSANRQGMKIASWGGSVLDGALSGTANVRWGVGWQVDGAMTVRGVNAAVFAPALLSQGKAEGSGRFSMSGADPAKLYNGARLEGSFTVGKGVLGSFDLSRVLHTSGRQHGGRTPFTEMTGQGVYDRGAVALRNISISAGALNAGASADIAPGGALAGRIVADVRTTAQPLRAIVVLGGTVKEPQVRN